ncbi:MAG: tyrosine-type recombinase/integrase [Acidobacteria bacterium]|nr:tyrosine-type recombinase/integrase [Acidobacteriota bacterium]
MPRKPKNAVKLTKRLLDSLPPAIDRAHPVWTADSELKGFFVAVYSTGQKVFFVRYWTGRARRIVRIGRYGETDSEGPVTPETARARAKEILAQHELGGDPAGDRDKAREMPTFKQWAERYLERVALEKKSPREDRRFLPMAVKRWGGRPLASLSTEDVLRLRQTMEKTPAQANRLIASIRACFSAAVRSGLITFNPARSIRPFKENPPRARVITPDEMERLLVAIEAEGDPFGKAALKILILTGVRGKELLRAKWEDLDLDAGTWRIPSPKAGHPQVVPIDANVTAVLKSIPRMEGSPFVIPGRTPDQPRYDVRGPWERAKERAGLAESDLHIHDIRRTFGLAVARQAGLHIASKLLRHSSTKITEQVYAPLGLDDLREALTRRADVLSFPEKKKGTG